MVSARRLILVLAFVAASPAVVHAAPVAIEVYVGDPPSGAAERAAPALDALAQRGYSVGVEGVGAVLEERVSRPARSGGVSVKDMLEKLATGEDQWASTAYQKAATTFSDALAIARKNPGLVVGNDALRERIFQAELLLARSLMRIGSQTRAREVMADLIVSFPDAKITRGDHGKEAAGLYDDVKLALEGGGRTELRIVVDDPDVDLFINERRIASGTITVDKFAGEYRIYTQRGTTPGRLHTVELRPGEPAEVEIEWMFEASLFTSGAGVGLRYKSEEEKAARVAADALKIAGYMDASQVTVFGEGDLEGDAGFIGTTYLAETGAAWRNGGVVLSPEPSADDLRSLAEYVAGQPPAPAVRMLEPIPPQYREKPAGSGSRHGWVKWTTAGTAVALGGLSVFLFSVDGEGTCGATDAGACPQLWNTTAGKWSSAAGAAVLTAATVWLFVDDPWKTSSKVNVGLVKTDAATMVTLGGTF